MRSLRRHLLVLMLILLPAGCSHAPRSFDPADPIAPTEFSHQLFDEIVRTHVKDGIVDYPRVSQDSRFQNYIQQLDRVDPNGLPTRNDRLALWINAYNAFAIQGILDGLSPLTLWGRYRYFIARDHQVGGRCIDLYDLEQKILIPAFHEPRIHFAIVCASRSCPKLQSWAYSPERLDEQLEQSARDYINDPTRNRFDRERRVARLSMIFKWFEQDFADRAGSLLHYVKPFVADSAVAAELESYRVEFLEYDWRLNGIPPEPVRGKE
jgi:hypothetical protein